MPQIAPKPAPEKALSPEQKRLRRQYLQRFYTGNRKLFFIASATMVLISSFNLVISWLMQRVIDAATGTEVAALAPLLLWTVVSFALFILSFLGQRYAQPRFMRRALVQYKHSAFVELTKKNISSFSRESTGKYLSALTNDVGSIENNFLRSIFQLVQLLVAFVGALTMMLVYSPVLTAVAVGLSILPMAASAIAGNRLAAEEKAVSAQNERFVGTLKDLLAGFPVVKSFKAEKQAVMLFDRDNEASENAKCKRRVTSYTIQLLGISTGVLAQMGVFLVGAYLAITGQGITPGVVIVFVQLMGLVLSPISEVPPILANRKAALQLVDQLAEAVSQNVRREGKAVDNRLDDGIDVDRLTFGYEEGQPILRDLSVRFEAGRSYAIVGSSGSGKSTLLSLLMGSFDSYTGTIRYDGDDLRDISSDSLYDLLTLVQQNVFIFNDTIRNNITLFRDFPQEKVDSAIARSGLSALIQNHGESYLCGENGSGLSGGERQRISIARALLHETPILLVDEATASLDAETAFTVTNAILDIAGLTRIVVTHRLESALLSRYDEILVMKGGSIAERGSFDELMAKRELFYSLYTVSQA